MAPYWQLVQQCQVEMVTSTSTLKLAPSAAQDSTSTISPLVCPVTWPSLVARFAIIAHTASLAPEDTTSLPGPLVRLAR